MKKEKYLKLVISFVVTVLVNIAYIANAENTDTLYGEHGILQSLKLCF